MTTFRFVNWCRGFKIGGHRLKSILRYSLTAFGANITWSLFSQIDSFILGKISGDHVLGLYTIGKQLATLPVSKISVIVNQLASPIMAKLQNDRHAMLNCFS